MASHQGERPSTAPGRIAGMRAKVIACETVAEELQGLLPEGVPYTRLEFGLHVVPERLHEALQREIDQTQEPVEVILLGYGLCAKGALGLRSRRFHLVIPRVDDCIGLFLGSRDAYRQQRQQAPGTFYLTKGWIVRGDDPYKEYRRLAAKYGEHRAYRIEKAFLEHYTRLALIRTGDAEALEPYRTYAATVAQFFGLTLEEVPGSRRLLQKMLAGQWDGEFVVVPPGGEVTLDHFLDDWRR